MTQLTGRAVSSIPARLRPTERQFAPGLDRSVLPILSVLALTLGSSLAISQGFGLLALGASMLLLLVVAPNGWRIGLGVVTTIVAGYVIGDRAFAYLGLSVSAVPVFVGELAIVVGIASFALTRRIPRLRVGKGWIIAALAWSFFVLVVRWGSGSALDTARDFSFVYYGIFAVFGMAVAWERASSRFFSVLVAVFLLQLAVAIATQFGLIPENTLGTFGELLSRGDVKGANLLGGSAFFLLADDRLRMPKSLRFSLAGLGVAIALLTASRAVAVAVLAVIAATVFWQRGRVVRVGLITAAVAGLIGGLFGISGLTREGEYATVTPTTVVERLLVGIGVGGSESVQLQANAIGTARWRLLFWERLWHRSTDDPSLMIIGRGFGSSLSEEAGLGEPLEENPTRAPHSIVVDVWARLGVIGLFFFGAVWIAIARAGVRLARDSGRVGMMGHWLLAYWLAMLAVSLFGVVLESPFGAAPFYFAAGGILRLASIRNDSTQARLVSLAR